jgi:hypothetical protein
MHVVAKCEGRAHIGGPAEDEYRHGARQIDTCGPVGGDHLVDARPVPALGSREQQLGEQEWVRHRGLKLCIVFESRGGAGKGGTFKLKEQLKNEISLDLAYAHTHGADREEIVNWIWPLKNDRPICCW